MDKMMWWRRLDLGITALLCILALISLLSCISCAPAPVYHSPLNQYGVYGPVDEDPTIIIHHKKPVDSTAPTLDTIHRELQSTRGLVDQARQPSR